MNLFEGRLQDGKIILPGFSIPILPSAFERSPNLRAFEGGPVIFGIRPEDLYDSDLQSGSLFATIPAQVRTIEELGSELIVHLNVDAVGIDSGDPDAVEDLGDAANTVARFEAVSAVRVGDSIELAIDAAKLHFFDPKTHLAI